MPDRPDAPRRPRGASVRAAAAADLARTGGRDAPVEVVEYDAAWPARFEAERDRLAPLLGGGVVLHHIGSTAVPGLAAKPTVDMMAVVDDLDAAVRLLVGRAGYQYPEAFNAELVDRRWLCIPSAEHRTHHLHLVLHRDELDRHLRFRDALQARPELAAEYAALKTDLAERFRGDREAYSEAKSAFVRRVEGEAQRD